MRKVDPVRHEEKRRAILAAATRCFEREGFQGASVAQICAEAGMSAGHLYHYFPGKEAIIEAMVDANLKRAGDLFGHVTEGQSVVDTLMMQLERYANDDDRGSPLLFDMFAEAGRNPTLSTIIREHSRGMETLLGELLRRGQERGEVDPALDPEAVAPVLISIVDGAKATGLRNPRRTPRDHRDMLRTLISRFLSRPDAG